MKLNRVFPAIAVLSLASALQANASTPTIGRPAPALTFTGLLQAPPGTKVDWPSLRGKVVVLEFWATWCAPCIAEIPHMNELAQSLATNNIQFIAVDDEDLKVVNEFLAKKHMEGWVGVGNKIFDDYGVRERPTSIVIDTHGKIAATLRPDQLDKDQLVALSNGEPASFPANSIPPEVAEAQKKAIQDAAAAMTDPAANVSARPLFDISIRLGDPDGITRISTTFDSESGQSSYEIKNATLVMLVPWATGIPSGRVVFHADPTKAHYNVHLTAPDLDLKQLAPALELAITSAAGIKLTRIAAQEDVYVLQATPQAAARLTPTASTHGSMCSLDTHTGKLKMVNTSLDNLAPALEQALRVPVVNEAGISGEFDATFPLPKEDFEAAKLALKADLGLTLVKARRSIERIVLDPLPPSAEKATTQPAKPNPAPGEPIQSVALPLQ